MKTLKIKLGFLSLLAVLAVSIFLTSCEQEVAEATNVELQEFGFMENHSYNSEDAYSTEELINLVSEADRQNFIDNLNADDESATEMGIESRNSVCEPWSDWYQLFGSDCFYGRKRDCHSHINYIHIQRVCTCVESWYCPSIGVTNQYVPF